MKKIRLVATVAALCMMATMTSCSKKEASVESRRNNNEVIVAIGSEPSDGFDSTTGGHGSITKIIFSTLYKRDKKLGWEGDLATGYKVSADKLTWTVTLRNDAYFTDGTKVTAEDVAFTYQTAKESGSEIDLTIIDSVEVVNENTVAFHLTRVYSPFIERMAYLGIVPKHAYNDDFKDNPIGSGPFKFVQWDKGQQVIFERNDNYYGKKAELEKLTIVFLKKDTAYAAIKKGSIDVAQIDGNLAEKKVEGTKIVDIPSIECYGVCFSMVPDTGDVLNDGLRYGNNVTSDPAIRQAFNVAIDRNEILEGVLHGYGTISTTGLEKMPWLNEKTVLSKKENGNVAEGKRILKEAGWVDADGDGILEKNGQKAEFTLLYCAGTYRIELALAFVNVGRQLGINVNLEQRTWDDIDQVIHSNAVLFGFGSGDPSELYNLYYGPLAGGVVCWDNAGVYRNELCDKAIDNALASMDEKEALKYWKEMQLYASAKGDAPYCWMVNANHVYLTLEGFDFGNPVVQPHGGRIFDNVNEWSWK